MLKAIRATKPPVANGTGTGGRVITQLPPIHGPLRLQAPDFPDDIKTLPELPGDQLGPVQFYRGTRSDLFRENARDKPMGF